MPSKTRILVIDDDEEVREILRDMLEGAGYEVMEAPDGNQGLNLLEANPVNVVITDILMPEKDGVETVIELRRRFPATKVIAISGGGRAQNLDFLQYAKKVGAMQILTKPIAHEALLAAVTKALESAQTAAS